MYLRRFRNRKKRRLLNHKGQFFLTHLGGGTLLYSFPGRERPVVGKIEFWRKKYRVRSYGAVMTVALFFGVMSALSNVSRADSFTLEELEKKEAILPDTELVEKSELVKEQLLRETDKYSGTGSKKKIIEYTVRDGDSLSAISARYRVPIEMITASSRIKANSPLKRGQKLIIPYRKGLIYKIKKGDRLAAIAQHYSVKLEEIIEDNTNLGERSNLDHFKPGQLVFLPNAVIPAPPPVWYRPGWGRVTSRFGMRRHPIHKTRRLHSGMDLGMHYKTVMAARSGHVIFAGRLGSYGNTIILEHNGGYKTLYAHLSSIRVRKGQFVKARARIAISGNSGLSTGPHLHFELIRYGRPINPRRKIRF